MVSSCRDGLQQAFLSQPFRVTLNLLQREMWFHGLDPMRQIGQGNLLASRYGLIRIYKCGEQLQFPSRSVAELAHDPINVLLILRQEIGGSGFQLLCRFARRYLISIALCEIDSFYIDPTQDLGIM